MDKCYGSVIRWKNSYANVNGHLLSIFYYQLMHGDTKKHKSNQTKDFLIMSDLKKQRILNLKWPVTLC